MVRFATLTPSLWPRAFASLRALGFNAVDLPVVWRDHERPDGSFDLTSGRHAVASVLDAAMQSGLRAIVRLGPMTTPDAAGLGLPERVLYDRRFNARTRRQNPVVVPDFPRLVPLPSLASVDYLSEATAWLRAVAGVVAPYIPTGLVARVILGYGPHPVLRDDPTESDHHPDARLADGDTEDALVRVHQETARMQRHHQALVAAVTSSGVPEALVTVAMAGTSLASPAVMHLADEHSVNLAAPPWSAGTRAIWRQVRHGCTLMRGVHWDLRAGGPVHGAPVGPRHAVQSARAAFAAGVRDCTVVMGCTGDRWAGALLDERAVPRAESQPWAELLRDVNALPTGDDIAATVDIPRSEMAEARATSAVRPLSFGFLSWLGAAPGVLSKPSSFVGVAAERRAARERALTEAGIPWRWTTPPTDRAPTDDTDAVTDTLRDSAVPTDPQGGALVRVVRTAGGLVAVVLSSTGDTVTVCAPESLGGGTVALAPGEFVVLTRGAGVGC